jgi:glycosyltransferase involved in cell wall biosynthesis
MSKPPEAAWEGRQTPAGIPDAQDAGDHDWDAVRAAVGGSVLSVVLPAHNLAATIADNLRTVARTFRGRVPFELIVVDDGSSDATRAEIEPLRDELPELRLVSLAFNAGKGGALVQGFRASRGTHILFLDADLDLPPEQATTFFEVMRETAADIVIGSKRHPRSHVVYPWHRRLASSVYYALVKLLFGMPLRDTQTGMKLFRRAALADIVPRLLVKQFAFDIELLAVAHHQGFRIAEAPVRLLFKGRYGCVRPTSVKQIVLDTLAVFYRLHVLRYYQTIRHTEMPDPAPRVSVVIACPAPSPYLDECLAGLGKQTYRPHEVIVLPDSPSGRAWLAGVREIPTGRIRPAEKRNIGILRATGDLVAILDDDTIPVENWLQQAVVYFYDPAIAAVGGPAVTPPHDPFLAQMSGRVFANPMVSGQYRYRYTPVRVRTVDDFPSCNLIVRRDVLDAAGGFNTTFWPGEDTFLCLDIAVRMKKTIVYDPRVLVYHHRRKLFLPHLRQVGRYAMHRGHFARRFPATSRRLGYMLPSLLVAGLAAGAIVSILVPCLSPIYFALAGSYGIITLLGTFSRRPEAWILTWLGVVLSHVVYGIRFVVGLASPRLPEDVQAFDHPSEAAS